MAKSPFSCLDKAFTATQETTIEGVIERAIQGGAFDFYVHSDLFQLYVNAVTSRAEKEKWSIGKRAGYLAQFDNYPLFLQELQKIVAEELRALAEQGQMQVQDGQVGQVQE